MSAARLATLAGAGALALAAVLSAAAPAAAEATVPTQDGWVDARQTAVTADGLSMTFVEMGDPEGDPVLLIHGFTDNSRSWSLLAPYLDGRRLIAVDLRGHGGSDAPACCYGPATLAHDVAGFMDAIGLERADVVGHSLGSMTAAVLAARHPEKVDDLVLVSTATEVAPAVSEWLWDNVSGLDFPLDPEGQFMTDWYWNPTPVDEAFLSRERAESANTPRQTWVGVLEGLQIVDWAPMAGMIEADVMILWGDQDGFFDAAAQDTVRAALPQAEFVTFEGLGHNMFWEAPERTAGTILPFLAD